MKHDIMRYVSILNYHTDGSRQRLSSFFADDTVKNLQLYRLLLCREFPQECFDHKGVINGHVRVSPNNRKTKLGKNPSSFKYAFC